MPRVFVNLDSFDAKKGAHARISYDKAHARGMLVNLKYGLASTNPLKLRSEAAAIARRIAQLQEQYEATGAIELADDADDIDC